MASDLPTEYLNVRETARRLGVHENTIRNWSRRGLLEPVELPDSRFRRFRASDVDRLSREREEARAQRPVRAHEFVDAAYLDNWEGRRAQELLPHLVRRLIAATPQVLGFAMRAEEGISVSGWDAEIEDCPGTAWVPAGPSRWELGTGADPLAKAQADYVKRSQDPLGANPENTTFVFVTQRRWPKAQDWARERKKDGMWRDVRVIDADLLSGWLEANPSIHLWLSEKVGLKPLDVRTLEDWWTRIAQQTRPPLSTELILAGRQEAGDELRNKLKESSAAVGVKARSREEALAFIAAALQVSETSGLPEAVIARSVEGWERLTLSESSMILIPDTDDEVAISEAVARGHHAVVPITSGEATNLSLVEVPPIGRTAAREAFEALGISLEQADRLAGLARRSFPALLRDADLAVGSRSRPPWGQGLHPQLLAPLLLAGEWTEREADQRIVAKVARREWEDIEAELRTWVRTDDPPFVEAGGVWRVASPEGAWAVLGDALSPSTVKRFCSTAQEVLEETDQALELSPEDRALAGIREDLKRPEISPILRRGLVQGLALLGALGDKPFPDGSKGSDYAEGFVHHLLEKATSDPTGLLWPSLSSELPRLAEAAPAAFLSGVEKGLTGDTPVLASMFRDQGEGSALFTSSPHTGLLWALETLCWSADFLSRAALVLARLAEIDPGGRLGNRPSASLRAIFLPWLPQTSAPLKSRLQVLELLGERCPDVAWKLKLQLLPKGHDHSSYGSSPRFRAWVRGEKGVSFQERLDMIMGLTDQVVKDAGVRLGRWTDLVEHIGYLPEAQRDLLLTGLEGLETDDAHPKERLVLWQKLVDETARHRSYPDAGWSMDEKTLCRLEAVAAHMEPAELVERHSRLFDWRPEIATVDRGNYQEWEQSVEGARMDAIKDTIDTSGIEGLERLANASVLPGQVGVTTARVTGDDFADRMIELLGSDGPGGLMAANWTAIRARDEGSQWIDRMVKELPGWPHKRQAVFLLALPPKKSVWTLLDQAPDEVSGLYWADLNPFGIEDSDVNEAVTQFLDHGRPWGAVDLLTLHCGPHRQSDVVLDPDLVLKALEAVLSGNSSEGSSRQVPAGYEIGLLLDYLEDTSVDLEVLARLEWAFFPLFKDSRREPKALFAALAETPSLFVDLVCRVYKGKSEPQRKVDEQTAALASHAWSVLHDWRRPPGLSEDGRDIDEEQLRLWVRKARLELSDRDRADIGDQVIGELLSGSPEGSDGAWPAEPVRNLIEDLASEDLETGFEVGRFNSRGITSRAVYAGGDQERELSKQYQDWANIVADHWPRTGRILQYFADRYEKDARHEDAKAHREASEG